MKRSKMTTNQQEYQKQIKRLERFIKNAEKRGFIFDDFQIPTRPQKVTKKRLQEIKDLKPSGLYKKAFAIDEYGEKIAGEVARKMERQIAAHKAAETRKAKKYGRKTHFDDFTYFPSESTMVLSNFKAEISNFPTFAQPVLNQWLSNVIAQHGSDAAAEMLQEGKEKGLIVNWEVAYKEGMLQQYMTEMLDYIPDLGQLEREALIEAFEQEESWSMPD